MRRSARPACMSGAYMSRLVSRWFCHVVHSWRSMSWALSVVCRSGDEVRGTCDDRIDLYPAAPIRLATMLYARTIALRRDGANLGDGTLAIRTSSHTSDPPTRIWKERPTSRWCGAASCLCVRNGMVKFSPKARRPWPHPRFLGARSHIMPIGIFGPRKRSRNG